jgi:CheY-like chemotaxis protein
MTVPRVVCVDDEPSFAELTATQLERHADVTATGFTDPQDALAALSDADCVVSDYDMPTMTGLEFLERVRAIDSDLPFVLFTGKGSETVASEAISKGVTEYLQKSTDASQYELLANRIQNAIDRSRGEREVERQRDLIERIVESTPVGVVVHDETGDVVVANRRARDLLAMPEASLHVRAYDASEWTLCGADGTELDAAELPVARVIDTGEAIRGERYEVTTGGLCRELVLNAEPLVNDAGGVDRVVVAFECSDEIEDIAR